MTFREDGHLSDEALSALARNEDRFDELERLEIAEHLAFCNECLQRYTELLTVGELLVPEHSCQKPLWARIRRRAFQMITSRYATAAAAVTLALTALWGGWGTELPQHMILEDRPSISRQLDSLTGELNASLRGTAADLSDFFDGLHFGQFRLIQGGNHA